MKLINDGQVIRSYNSTFFFKFHGIAVICIQEIKWGSGTSKKQLDLARIQIWIMVKLTDLETTIWISSVPDPAGS